MFFTRECDYGFRIMRSLCDGEMRTVKSISEMENIPYQYTFKILKRLRDAGFLQTIRGRDGGYVLNTSLDDITIYDVAAALNENLFINNCLKKSSHCSAKKREVCGYHQEIKRQQFILEKEMRSKKLSELVHS